MLQDYTFCGLKQEDYVGNQTLKDKTFLCLVPLYLPDINRSPQQSSQEFDKDLMKGFHTLAQELVECGAHCTCD